MSALRKARVSRVKNETLAPIDPALPGARKRILARFPSVLRGLQVAPPEAASLVVEYAEARDLAKACADDQETAGSALALLVGDAEGLVGDGFQVTWNPCQGRVNWETLARFLMGYVGSVPWASSEKEAEEKINAWRGEPSRTLRVTLASGAKL